MLRYTLKRLLYGLLVILGVVTLVFFLFNILPGDPARMMLGQRADAESIEVINRDLGRDKPVGLQFLNYLNDLAPISFHNNRDRSSYFYLDTEKYSPYTTLLKAKGTSVVLKAPYLRRSYQSKRKVSEIIADAAAKAKKNNDKNSSGIVVKGVHDVSVRFSKCCNPLPGDEIVGFVTRGRGISIHRNDCINILSLTESERVRLIDAEWQDDAVDDNSMYQAEIVIYANNRNGLLVDVSRALTEKNISITSLNTRVSKQGVCTMMLSFETKGREELNRIIEKLNSIQGIIDIERRTG